ncbi:MBL fold metallo-hydrolase [Methanobacterium formicicum]|uniref:Beta-lactamase domain-containing protein n=1 Tax=Methanobacterium formicicum (strain DSM 3637 / PP1) TaxID=1204725 RepID=K2QWL3_METFP|nr:MBL fold metallo-hydrolase [Methanobacterium formicicum]EKF84698.1 beta-lactamase domain-containing protein [Methanobacterium formicicum DSM 3637]
MKLVNYQYKKTSKLSWAEVFQNLRNITVHTFQTGSVIINLKGTLNPDHPRARDVEDKEIEVPILAHWIHHQEKGDFLLDVGLDSSYFKDPCGGLEGTSVDEYQQQENENIGHHLEKRGINLEMVFLSHLHSDHAAGVRELPKNIPYVTGKGEYKDYQPEVHGDFLEGLKELFEIDYSLAQNMPFLGPSVDLLGDGSLWAIHTPGHTPGHSSFLVNGVDGPVLMAMDAAFIRENLKLGVAPIDYTGDVEMAQETLEKILTFLRLYPQVRVVAGHEDLK